MESGLVSSMHENSKNLGSTATPPNSFSCAQSSDTSVILQRDLELLLNWSDINKEEETALLRLSDIKKKKQGIFFTPSKLVALSVGKFNPIDETKTYFDPACGTGNLLVEIAKSFDIASNLEETLVVWNTKIYGLDLEQKFINITKKKLIRLAIDKGSRPSKKFTINSLMRLLNNLKVGNFIHNYKDYLGVIDNLILNPPFSVAEAPKSINWSSGKLNAAALFLYYGTEILPINGKIIGIFPDVLRSGSRYAKLRSHINDALSPTYELYGEFQKNVQIDVFILEGKKQIPVNNIESIPSDLDSFQKNLSDVFDVSVGPVVPHRDKSIGLNAPYVHAKSLPAWGEISSIDERITHQGRKIITPFVAIRRTSSPKDKSRAIATIVNCTESVAVENHIIVAIPKNNDIETCRKLLKHLSSISVNEYINSKIRCRHLTVNVIKGIPLQKDFNDR